MTPQRIIDTGCFERQSRTDLLDAIPSRILCAKKRKEEALAFKRTADGATLHAISILTGSFLGAKARKELNTYSAQTPPNTSNTHSTVKIPLDTCPPQPPEREQEAVRFYQLQSCLHFSTFSFKT